MDGDCIGGFTKATWSSKNGHQKDESAFLFNLNMKKSHPCINKNMAIRTEDSRGPIFGDETLSIYESPFNSFKACMSRGNDEFYGIPLL